jgi:hypothetical protein
MLFDKLDANIIIEKLGNEFLNTQWMFVKLIVTLILSLPLHHYSQSFNFINTTPYEEWTFVNHKLLPCNWNLLLQV